MYGRGNLRDLKGVVEVRTRPLPVEDCKRTGLRFFVDVHERGCGWLNQVELTHTIGVDCHSKLNLYTYANDYIRL